jgi:hypothetical protein
MTPPSKCIGLPPREMIKTEEANYYAEASNRVFHAMELDCLAISRAPNL